ncbi:hypothetical protein ABZ719_28645 [Streptomyces sp. NPDC006743]|uniref:hypothetical protein n=1 Tax=Streptomyces sp. NPDC006743 TaxID=3154480 RepID=UPI003454951F
MTVVDTPPPLPVRDRADSERAWGGVSPMLTRLAAERATGLLVRERGTLHLDEGRVAHAESPLAPGLDILLTTHGTLRPEVWRDAVSRAGGPPGAAQVLLADGRLTEGALHLCHLGTLYDAAYFVLAPSSTPGRFRYGAAAHRLGTVPTVPVDALERATLRRRALLDRIWPDARPDSAPLLRTSVTAAPRLTSRQRALLDLVDGTRTAADLARDLGRQAFHTLVDVRRLAAAGLLAPQRRPDPPPGTPGPPDPYAAPVPAFPGPPDTRLTETGPPDTGPGDTGPTVALPSPAGSADPWLTQPAHGTDPHITLLKRLRDALEAL